MRQFHFFDKKTGILHGKSIQLNVGKDVDVMKLASANAPDGHEPIEGIHDIQADRVDLETKAVVPYQPPTPGGDHAWDTGKRRWLLTPEAGARIQKKRSAQARIAQLEAQQARRVRELLAASDPRLSAIDAEIQGLRKDLDQGSTD